MEFYHFVFREDLILLCFMDIKFYSNLVQKVKRTNTGKQNMLI